MKRIEHKLFWNQLDRLKHDLDLVPILRDAGMPIEDDLTPKHGTLRWQDGNGDRTFIWEGDEVIYATQPKLQQQTISIEEPTPESSVGKRAISFED